MGRVHLGRGQWAGRTLHLLVPVDDAPRVDELGGPQQLVEDVAFVDVLQQSALADDGIQVRVWGAMQVHKWGVGCPGGTRQVCPMLNPGRQGHLYLPTACSPRSHWPPSGPCPGGAHRHLGPAHCLYWYSHKKVCFFFMILT